MSDESKIFEASLQRLLLSMGGPDAVRGCEGRWMPELWTALAEMGVPWLGIPEEHGGAGGDVADAALAIRIAAARAVPLPIAETALLGGWLLASAGLQVPPEAPLTCAVEPLRAERSEGGLRVTGTADEVPWAADCGYLVALCAAGDSTHVVLIRTADEEIGAGDNIAGEPRCRVTLRGVVPVEDAPSLISTDLLLARAAAVRALQISGAADQVLALCVEHAKTREQFGKPIGHFQAVAHLLARIAGAAVAAQGAAHLALLALRHDDFSLAGSAKVVASEAAGTVAELAHQVHGAIGMTREHRLHLFTRRLWAWRDEYGSDRYWAGRCGSQLVSTTADPWRDLVVA